MKILHISDWHGQFLFPDEQCDVIVSSGDMLPIFARNNIVYNISAQKYWIRNNISRFKNLIGDSKFLSCSGNHDFVSLASELVKYNIDAVDLDTTWIKYEGISFAGFPYIPYIIGEWNFELVDDDLRKKTNKFLDKCSGTDILVMHCPPYGILDELDKFTKIGGNVHLTNSLFYRMEMLPKALCCGHFHLNYGITKINNILFSNAATTYNVLEI